MGLLKHLLPVCTNHRLSESVRFSRLHHRLWGSFQLCRHDSTSSGFLSIPFFSQKQPKNIRMFFLCTRLAFRFQTIYNGTTDFPSKQGRNAG